MMLMLIYDIALDGKSFEHKMKIARETPDWPLQSGNPGYTAKPAQPPVSVHYTYKSLFDSNILAVFGGLLIHLWWTVK